MYVPVGWQLFLNCNGREIVNKAVIDHENVNFEFIDQRIGRRKSENFIVSLFFKFKLVFNI